MWVVRMCSVTLDLAVVVVAAQQHVLDPEGVEDGVVLLQRFGRPRDRHDGACRHLSREFGREQAADMVVAVDQHRVARPPLELRAACLGMPPHLQVETAQCWFKKRPSCFKKRPSTLHLSMHLTKRNARAHSTSACISQKAKRYQHV